MPIRIIRRDLAALAGGVLVSPKAIFAQTDTVNDAKAFRVAERIV